MDEDLDICDACGEERPCDCDDNLAADEAEDEPEEANLFSESLKTEPKEPDWSMRWNKTTFPAELADVDPAVKAELYPLWEAYQRAHWLYGQDSKAKRDGSVTWAEAERLRQLAMEACKPWLSDDRYAVWTDLAHCHEEAFSSASDNPFCDSLHGREALVWKRVQAGDEVPPAVLDEFPRIRDRHLYGKALESKWKSSYKHPDANADYILWAVPGGFLYSAGAGVTMRRGKDGAQGHGSYGGQRGKDGVQRFDDPEPFETLDEAKRAALLACVRQLDESIVEAELHEVTTKAVQHAREARAWCEAELGEPIPQQLEDGYCEKRAHFLEARRLGYDSYEQMVRVREGSRYEGDENPEALRSGSHGEQCMRWHAITCAKQGLGTVKGEKAQTRAKAALETLEREYEGVWNEYADAFGDKEAAAARATVEAGGDPDEAAELEPAQMELFG